VIVWIADADAGVTAWEVRRREAKLRRAGLEERTITAEDGSTVHYWTGGDGPPLVLVHGFGGSAVFTWTKQRSLAKTHRLVVPDLLWFGESHGNGTPDLDRQVAAVRAAVRAEGVSRADWLGVSYGGFVALDVAIRHPDEVRRLVLVDSPGPVWTRADHAAMLARLGIAAPEDLFVPKDPRGIRALLRLAYHHPPAVPRFALRDAFRELYAHDAEERRALLRDLDARWDAWASTPWTVDAPALVVWGEHDLLFPLDAGHRLAGQLGADLVSIPGAAHSPNVEKGRRFNRAVEGFLQNASP
jgi:pimeloyl-ACP methyl ester carboxylesterase